VLNKIWLYGGSAETIMETIRKGRNNVMPAFSEFLGEAKVHVLAAISGVYRMIRMQLK